MGVQPADRLGGREPGPAVDAGEVRVDRPHQLEVGGLVDRQAEVGSFVDGVDREGDGAEALALALEREGSDVLPVPWIVALGGDPQRPRRQDAHATQRPLDVPGLDAGEVRAGRQQPLELGIHDGRLDQGAVAGDPHQVLGPELLLQREVARQDVALAPAPDFDVARLAQGRQLVVGGLRGGQHDHAVDQARTPRALDDALDQGAPREVREDLARQARRSAARLDPGDDAHAHRGATSSRSSTSVTQTPRTSAGSRPGCSGSEIAERACLSAASNDRSDRRRANHGWYGTGW